MAQIVHDGFIPVKRKDDANLPVFARFVKWTARGAVW
jgi:hypothetical protein